MDLVYNTDSQRLQQGFGDTNPATLAGLLRTERTASVPVTIHLVDDYGQPEAVGLTEFELAVGRGATITEGTAQISWTTGQTAAIDLSSPKLSARIESALNAVAEIDAAGGVDVETVAGGHKITFRAVGARDLSTVAVNSAQPNGATVSQISAGSASGYAVHLLTLDEGSLAAIQTTDWSRITAPAVTVTAIEAGTASIRKVDVVEVTGEPAPGSYIILNSSPPISTDATAAEFEAALTIPASVERIGERKWQITEDLGGTTTIAEGDHNLTDRSGASATLSLDTAELAAYRPDELTFTLRRSGEVYLSESLTIPEPMAEDIVGSSPAVYPRIVTSTVDPTSGDDAGEGYANLTLWHNATSGQVFTLTDNSEGAAVWNEPTTQPQVDINRAMPKSRRIPVARQYGVPALGRARQLISTQDGAKDYNSWPVGAYLSDRDVIAAFWRRGTGHGNADGEVMMSLSTDGNIGKAWTTPTTIITSSGDDYRDVSILALADRVLLFAPNYETWAVGEDVSTEVYESFDLDTWTQVGTIEPSGEEVGTMGGYNKAVSNAAVMLPGGTIIATGFETNDHAGNDYFFRSAAWASTDLGRTWVLRSEIMGPTFGTPNDPSTVVQQPNETTVIPIRGDLVAFIRDEDSGQLWRLESADDGATWGTAVDVDPSESASAKPNLLHLLDGRLMLSTRLARTNFSSWTQLHISDDAGLTWGTDSIIGFNDYSEYETFVQVEDGRVLSLAGCDDDPARSASSVYAWDYMVDQSPDRSIEPPAPSNLKLTFDADSLSPTGDSAPSGVGTPWESSSGREVAVGGYYDGERKVADIDGSSNDGMFAGAVGDYNFLHTGGAMTIGVCFSATARTQNSNLFGTATASDSNHGFNLYTGTSNRVSLYVGNGLAGGAAGGTADPEKFGDSLWGTIIVRFDGTTYETFYNGRWIKDWPIIAAHSATDHTRKMFIGQPSETTSARDACGIRRVAAYDSELSDDDLYKLNYWLTK